MQENEPNFEKHIDDIVKAIGDKLERNVIANELKRYVDEYGIDLATAKESIVRKHYGNPNELNIGGEKQKSGIGIDEATDFYNMCIKDLNLNIIGLMCLPPANLDPAVYFEKMEKISSTLSLKELSMGMSSDFLKALKFRTSFVRIGSKIFGKRN